MTHLTANNVQYLAEVANKTDKPLTKAFPINYLFMHFAPRSVLVDWDEQIKAHLFWVWGEEEGFFKRGKEGMLVITDRRVVFISKTEMTYKMHETHSLRQAKRFEAGEKVFRPAEGYKLEHLERDIDKSADNLEIPFSQIMDVFSEEKRWGTLLKIKVNLGDMTKIYKFSMVKGWVKYPAKDPIGFQKMDWTPLINLVRTST